MLRNHLKWKKFVVTIMILVMIAASINIDFNRKVYSAALLTPCITSPSNWAALSKENVTVTWSSINGANYYLFAAVDTTTGIKFINNSTVYGTSYSIASNNLTEGHSYKIAVGAYSDSCDASLWATSYFTIKSASTPTPTLSPTPTFRPISTPTPSALAAPTISASISGVVNKDTGSILVNWNSVDPSACYCIAIKKVSTGTSVWNYNRYIATTSYTIGSDVLKKLEYNTNYYIYVTAFKGWWYSGESNYVSFSTGAQPTVTPKPTPKPTPTPTPKPTPTPCLTFTAPIITSPGNGNTISKSNPTFTVSWGTVPGAVRYYYAVIKNGTGSNLYEAGNNGTTATSVSLSTGTLEASTSYTVRVTALNSNGTTTSCTVNFVTGADPFTATLITLPSNGSTISKSNPTFTVSWATVPGAVLYYYAVIKNGTGSNLYEAGNNGTTATSVNLSTGTLEASTSYTIRITALNSNGTTTSSTVNFVTGASVNIQGYKLSGYVNDGANPIAGADVYLDHVGDPKWHYITDASGYYEFKDVSSGTTHTVYVEKNGFLASSPLYVPIYGLDACNQNIKIMQIKVLIDEKYMEFNSGTGYPYLNSKGIVLFPLNASMEAFGATVTWNNKKQTAYVIKGNRKVSISLHHKHIKVKGRTIKTTVKAVKYDGKIYSPIKEVLKALGATVIWDETTNTLIINSSKKDKKRFDIFDF